MSEPQAPLPPLPEPFAPAPRPLRTPGCGRGALIGCAVLLVLFGIGAVALAMNKDRMLVWMFQRFETQVVENMPADVTPAERARFSAAFADLYRALEEGKIEPAAVQPLQSELFSISMQVDRGLSREQVLRLTEAAERAAGHAARAPAAAPSPP